MYLYNSVFIVCIANVVDSKFYYKQQIPFKHC